MPSRILVTGGGGQLARELLTIDPSIDAPTRKQLDFSSYDGIVRYCEGKSYDVIIHAGAVTNKFSVDVDEEYIESNIIGTANIVLCAKRLGVRLVYISSDYVYPSERGGYTEESVLFPVNRYAKSKLGGEMAVQLYDNSLIIRTSFYSSLNFPKGCTDQHSSRLSISDAARAIYELSCKDDFHGVINLGSGQKRSLFDIIRNEFNPLVEPVRRADIKISYIIPPDSSMDTSKYERIIEEVKAKSKDLRRCRVCNSEDLYKYLDLGYTPLANSYLQESQLSGPEYKEELALQLCLNCGLSQLTRIVNPDLMFKNYLYVSSTTQTFRDHCAEFARTATAVAYARPKELVLDIASNDGCLLSKFREVDMNVLGVDPAENIANEANASGIRTLCAYWSTSVARDIVSRFGTTKIITATNVFAHVDDVHEFIEGVNACMAQKGVLVIEVPYLIDFIERSEFDTAYHEHLSYFAISPLSLLMNMHGLQVFDVHYFPHIHGGTVRVFVSRGKDYPVSNSVVKFLEKEGEFGIKNRTRYDLFTKTVMENKIALRQLIFDLRKQGKTIWAYGASAKGNTLMNFFELEKDEIAVAIDDNPKKWGHYAPGSRMRITGISELSLARVDYLLLLAWNFKEEIMRRCKAVNYSGDFILPVPKATIISNKK